jgi:hypothetical protein
MSLSLRLSSVGWIKRSETQRIMWSRIDRKEIYKQKSADILELAKLAASQPINISQTQGDNMAGDRNIHMGSGNYLVLCVHCSLKP